MSSSGVLQVLAEIEEEKLDFEELAGVKASELNFADYLRFARRHIYYRRNKVEQVEKLIETVLSGDPHLQLRAFCAIRKLAFIDKDTNALKQLVANHNFMLLLLSFFDKNALSQLQYEAVWTLSIFYNTPECLPDLVNIVNSDDIVPILADLVCSADEIRRLAFFSLGKLASTSEHICDSVVDHALIPLLHCSNKIEDVQVAAVVLLHCSKAIVKMDLVMVSQVLHMLQQILLSIDTNDYGMDTKDKGKTELLVNTTQALASIGINAANQVVTNDVLIKLVELIRYKSVPVVNAALDALASFSTGRIQDMIKCGILSEILRILIGDIEEDGKTKNRAVIVASRIFANGDPEHIEDAVCYGVLYALLDTLRGLPIEEKKEVALGILGIASNASRKTISIVERRFVHALDILVAESLFSRALKRRCLKARSIFKRRYSKRKRPWTTV